MKAQMSIIDTRGGYYVAWFVNVHRQFLLIFSLNTYYSSQVFYKQNIGISISWRTMQCIWTHWTSIQMWYLRVERSRPNTCVRINSMEMAQMCIRHTLYVLRLIFHCDPLSVCRLEQFIIVRAPKNNFFKQIRSMRKQNLDSLLKPDALVLVSRLPVYFCKGPFLTFVGRDKGDWISGILEQPGDISPWLPSGETNFFC